MFWKSWFVNFGARKFFITFKRAKFLLVQLYPAPMCIDWWLQSPVWGLRIYSYEFYPGLTLNRGPEEIKPLIEFSSILSQQTDYILMVFLLLHLNFLINIHTFDWETFLERMGGHHFINLWPPPQHFKLGSTWIICSRNFGLGMISKGCQGNCCSMAFQVQQKNIGKFILIEIRIPT